MVMHITLPLAAVLLFLTTLMFLVGLQVTLPDLMAMTRNYGLVARSLLANIVLFPILAVLLTAPAHLPREVLIGVLLMAAAPGVPFLPRIASAAKGNLVFAIDLTILLQVASVVTTPVTLRWILPVEDAVKVPVLRIIATLVVFQLLPLALGMLVRRQAPQHAAAVAKPVRALSTVGLVGTLVFFIVPHLDVLAKVAGGGALMSMLLLVVLAWPIGWVLGGADASIRKTLAIGTSLRNVGLCLLIATREFSDSGVGAVVFAYFLIQAIVNFVYAMYLGRGPEREPVGASGRPS
jgi:bile acid:Na+ symporter, BASS family